MVGKTNCSRLENGAGKLQLSATHMKETAMPPWQNEKNHLTISIGFLVWDIFERVSHPQKWLKPDKEYLKRNLECKSRIFCTSYNLIIWLISSFKKDPTFPKGYFQHDIWLRLNSLELRKIQLYFLALVTLSFSNILWFMTHSTKQT